MNKQSFLKSTINNIINNYIEFDEKFDENDPDFTLEDYDKCYDTFLEKMANEIKKRLIDKIMEIL